MVAFPGNFCLTRLKIILKNLELELTNKGRSLAENFGHIILDWYQKLFRNKLFDNFLLIIFIINFVQNYYKIIGIQKYILESYIFHLCPQNQFNLVKNKNYL